MDESSLLDVGVTRVSRVRRLLVLSAAPPFVFFDAVFLPRFLPPFDGWSCWPSALRFVVAAPPVMVVGAESQCFCSEPVNFHI